MQLKGLKFGANVPSNVYTAAIHSADVIGKLHDEIGFPVSFLHEGTVFLWDGVVRDNATIEYEYKVGREDDSITPGEIYRHKNGNEYVVLGFSNCKDTNTNRVKYPPTVRYVLKDDYNPDDSDRDDLVAWSRPIQDWFRSFEYVGKAD